MRVGNSEVRAISQDKEPEVAFNIARELRASTIVLYNAFQSCPLTRLNLRSLVTDVMSYKCYSHI